jgi:hypothetical protein
LIGNTVCRAIVLALAASAASAGVVGCTHDFDEFNVSADASGDDGALPIDGSMQPNVDGAMVDANRPFDAGIDAPPPCTPNAGCLTTAQGCATTCAQQESMCRGMCGGNQGCINRCIQKQQQCDLGCENTCVQCTQSSGCVAQQACADASMSD